MIDIKLLIGIIGGLVAISTGIVGFFTMQTRQNMKIEQLQKDLDKAKDDLQAAIDELRRKQSMNTNNQIKTEKELIKIDAKLDHILEAIEDLKSNGHP